MKKSILTCSLALLISGTAIAQMELLKDLNSTPSLISETSLELEDPHAFIAVGGKIIFSAYDGTHGWELWVTDNTQDGTSLLKDFLSPVSEPSSFTLLNDVVYFAVTTDAHGRELWKTDGTAVGTERVTDINPDGESGLPFPDFLTEMNGSLYFRADDGAGYALWKSDGTTAGTAKVKDLEFAASSSAPRRFTVMNNVLYFSGFDVDRAYELWRSDGTTAGTYLVKDLQPGTDYGYPENITVLGDHIYFTAFSASGGKDIWKSDGTTGGTVLLKNIHASGYPAELISGEGLVFFTSDDASTGRELWRTDGSPAGTFLINKSTYSLFSKATQPVAVNGNTFFVSAGDGNNRELWKTDGTLAGTTLVKDIYPGSSTASPEELVKSGSVLYFSCNDGVTGQELWQSDGTAAGTVLIADIATGSGSSEIRDMTVVNGSLYFGATSHSGSDSKLWWYDIASGDATNLAYKATYSFDHSASSYPSWFTKINGTFYFKATDATHGTELWKSDGTAAGTLRVRDINTGTGDAWPNSMVNVNGTLFFAADNGVQGTELWKSDGTAAGTVMVKDIALDALSSMAFQKSAVLGNVLYFVSDDGVHGMELWKSDGTEAGTVMVTDLNSGPQPSVLSNLTASGDVVYFLAENASAHKELWKTDGTAGGTVKITSIYDQLVYAEKMADVNGMLFFTGFTDFNGIEMWRTDGTPEGTMRLTDIATGPWSAQVQQLVNVNGTLFFAAEDDFGTSGLWKSDGSVQGTVRLESFYGFNGPGNPIHLTPSGDLLFFALVEPGGGSEIWVSDGTDAGTHVIKDISQGDDGKYPRALTGANGHLFFLVFDETGQYQLWKSDGTSCGTVPLTNDAVDHNFLEEIMPVGNNLFFASGLDGSSNGNELYVYKGYDAVPGRDRCQSISFPAIVGKKYGDGDFTLVATASSGLPVEFESSDPETLFIDGNTATILKAGYVYVTVRQPGDASYDPANSLEQFVEIGKADLAVKADDKTITYGEPIPEATITYEGFIGADDPSVLDSQPYPEIIATDESEPGTYEIYVYDAWDDNYNYVLTNGTLEILKLTQTISFAALASKTYGDGDFDLTASTDSGLPLQYASADPAVALIDGTTVRILKAGSVDITISQPGDEVYEQAAVTRTLIVDKASLIVWADDKTMTYGEAIPTLTYRHSGFKGSDNISSLNTLPVVSTEATAASAPGTYAITVAPVLGNNYTVVPMSGELVIKKAQQTITFATVADQVEGGGAFTVTATASSGLPVTIVSSSQKISINGKTISITDAGRVMVRAEQSGNEFYEPANAIEQSFCINPAKPIVTLSEINPESPVLTSSSATGNQWFLNAIAIGNEDQSLGVDQQGVYTVKVTRDDCTSSFSDAVTMIVTSTAKEVKEAVELFPNPVVNILTVRLEASQQNKVENIFITDVKGVTKEVIDVNGRTEISTDVTDYPSGIYILMINSRSTSGTKIFVKK